MQLQAFGLLWMEFVDSSSLLLVPRLSPGRTQFFAAESEETSIGFSADFRLLRFSTKERVLPEKVEGQAEKN